MKTYERASFGWIVGYFVVLYPLMYAKNGSLIWGLINGIVGVLTAVMILWFGKRWGEFK